MRPPIVWGDMVTIVLGKHGVKIQLACFFSFTPFEVKLVQNKCKSSLNTDVTFRTDRKNMNHTQVKISTRVLSNLEVQFPRENGKQIVS